MKKSLFLLPSLAVGAAAVLLAPPKESAAFALNGGSLGVSAQRDFRVFNNFNDATTNDNPIGSSQFPGWLGAELALWKAASEWASQLHGDGSGDPTQNIGDGGANFDFVWSGRATSAGGINANISSAIPSCGGGGTFAYVILPVTNGWTMKFCDEWTWSDGPGQPIGGQIDLQGVGCHEFGHSLGLGHSGVPGATMVGSTVNGFDQRSIATDDSNGVKAIYGAKAANKVTITGVSVDTMAGTITVTGTNFSGTNNQLWFTNINPTGPASDPRVIVSGLSSTGLGTQIVANIPADAADGDVHVKSTASGGLSLSNGFPADLGNPFGGGPLEITNVNPLTVDALIPGTAQTVTITGTGFTQNVVVAMDLVPLPTSSYTIVDQNTITFDMPQLGSLGSHTLTVQEGGQLDFEVMTVQAPSGLVLQVGTGDPLNVVSGSMDVLVSGTPGDLHYVLYSGSNLPSKFLPYACWDIGNSFQDINEFGQITVNASSAVTTVSVPLPAISTTVYFQSTSFSFGLPLADSNVQSIVIVP